MGPSRTRWAKWQAGLLTATVAAALLAAGCKASTGSDPGQASKGSGGDEDPVARYAQCMREHGVSNFPDPVDGRIQLGPGSGVDQSSSRFRAADKACQKWSPQSRRQGSGTASAQAWGAFADWLKRRVAAGAFSGAVLVARDGRPLIERADGLANLERGAANTTGTRFNIGSVGKMFTAVAIAQLAEQGKLSFDDPVGNYLSGLPPELAQITIAQLLTHTSGLGDVFARWNPTASPLDVSQVLQRIAREPLQFQPGTRFAYSNSGYVVLGAVVEAVSGRSYYDYVRERVLEPAGMTHTGWYTLDQLPNMAHGYVRVQGQGAPAKLRDSNAAGGWGNPSGGAYSTLGDLLGFARALLRHKLLTPAMTELVLTGKVDTGRPGPTQLRYGYGFEDETRDGVRVVGHGGGAPGVEAQLRIYPTLGYTTVVLANRDAAATPVSEEIHRVLAQR